MRISDEDLAAEIRAWKGCYGEERMARMLFDLQDARRAIMEFIKEIYE